MTFFFQKKFAQNMYRFRFAIIGLATILFVICVWGIVDSARNLKENLQWNQNLTRTIMPTPTSNVTWLPNVRGEVVCQWTHYDYFFDATTCAHGYDKKLSVTIYGVIVFASNNSGVSCEKNTMLQFPEPQDFFCHNSNRSVTAELELYWPLDEKFDCSVDSRCTMMDQFISNETTAPTMPQKEKGVAYLVSMISVLSVVSFLVLIMIIYCIFQAKKERDLDKSLLTQLLNA